MELAVGWVGGWRRVAWGGVGGWWGGLGLGLGWGVGVYQVLRRRGRRLGGIEKREHVHDLGDIGEMQGRCRGDVGEM